MFDSIPPESSSLHYDGADEIGWGIASTSEPSLGANSLPNDDGLVALAQITLPRNSSLSGTLNFKVQPNSNSNLPTEIARISFDIPEVTEGLDLQFANAGGGIAGCTDETACNFNDAACVDDESCEFESCLGCTDEGACNFNAEATVDDGSCEYTICEGCTDEEACNFDPEALIDDGSCVFPGCTNGCACNFDPNACADDGSCQYEDVLGNCGGDCSSDLDGDDICDDVDECVGMFDSCGVCNGQGAIYDCGCSDIPEGDCDCNGTSWMPLATVVEIVWQTRTAMGFVTLTKYLDAPWKKRATMTPTPRGMITPAISQPAWSLGAWMPRRATTTKTQPSTTTPVWNWTPATCVGVLVKHSSVDVTTFPKAMRLQRQPS